jgi:hypothetical protein
MQLIVQRDEDLIHRISDLTKEVKQILWDGRNQPSHRNISAMIINTITTNKKIPAIQELISSCSILHFLMSVETGIKFIVIAATPDTITRVGIDVSTDLMRSNSRTRILKSFNGIHSTSYVVRIFKLC